MRTKFFSIFTLICLNCFVNYAQTNSKDAELAKITKLFIVDVDFGIFMDSTHPYYISLITFAIDSTNNRPIILHTCDYPTGSTEVSRKQLQKFVSLDLKWNLLVPDLENDDKIILPFILSRDPNLQQVKPNIPFNQSLTVALQCIINTPYLRDIKVMEPIHYFMGKGGR